ncbi:MAG: DUF1634 domain-containing protein [Chloroflexia bacterium]|nr:DUF1634 domain-containing protein [Chloroflexia bacterium]
MSSDRTMHTSDGERLRELAARVLEIGFRVAVAIMAVGLVLAVIRQEALPSTLEQPADIAEGIVQGDPEAIVGLGIISIILTPFASTLVIAIAFYRQGDRRYAAISGLVLAILLVSIGLSLI